MGAIFVYGTLLQGQSRGSLILAASPRRIISARTPGRLMDLGDYPGLIAASSSGQWVFGEFAEFDSVESQNAKAPQAESEKLTALLAQLDLVEEYMPDAEADSLYLRRSVTVVLEDGTESRAWVYLYNRPYDPRSIIRNGDWRQRGK